MNKPVLTIVVPCYNEEEVLLETASQLSEVLQDIMHDFSSQTKVESCLSMMAVKTEHGN